ncbi:hypothetical protein Hanom_Chr03g00209581 [Helianthus anomalus]
MGGNLASSVFTFRCGDGSGIIISPCRSSNGGAGGTIKKLVREQRNSVIEHIHYF